MIKAWENGGLLKDEKIKNLIKTFGKKENYNFELGTVKDFLEENNNWFKEIFIKNL